MGGNTFGKIFAITTFGESHGPAIGVITDGCPAGLELCEQDIQMELERRKPGQARADGTKNHAVTPRKESDQCQILSGVFEGKTTGTPIAIIIKNETQRSADYSAIKDVFRPGHADYTYHEKYGFRDYRGGGRASGRETAARVAGGAIAKKLLAVSCGVRITSSIIAQPSEEEILALFEQGDSSGGILECIVQGVPVGWGEPVFDKLDAQLAKAALSIGGVKGIEFGAGFKSACMNGSNWNDAMRKPNPGSGESNLFVSNNAGGILGGITNGNDIVFRVVLKPVPSISIPQHTIDIHGHNTEIQVHGRHDICLCTRIAPVLEAMAALVLADAYLENRCARL